MTPIKGDKLTADLLLEQDHHNNSEAWKEYDAVTQRHIVESRKHVSKRQAANEFAFIDDKIKLIHEMAEQMSSDYTKYNKALSTVQELAKQRDELSRCQARQEEEEERARKRAEADMSRQAEVKFYERKEAESNVQALKKRIAKPRIPKPEPSPRKHLPAGSSSGDVEKLEKDETEEEEEELSELKENEKVRLEKILLGLSATSSREHGRLR